MFLLLIAPGIGLVSVLIVLIGIGVFETIKLYLAQDPVGGDMTDYDDLAELSRAPVLGGRVWLELEDLSHRGLLTSGRWMLRQLR